MEMPEMWTIIVAGITGKTDRQPGGALEAHTAITLLSIKIVCFQRSEDQQ
jgi:hypothetical protein